MTGKRSYDDPCGVARALSVIGERWALLVARELLMGPKRFTDLSRGLPGMSQNVLSQRLRELEQSGVVRRRRLGPPANVSGYELTELGRLLDPVLVALATWGSRIPLQSQGDLSVDAFVLALRTTFDAKSANELEATFELRLDDDVFHASIGAGRFEIARGPASRADATLTTDVATLRSVVFGGRPIADAIKAGDLRVEGDKKAAARFSGSFPRPVPIR